MKVGFTGTQKGMREEQKRQFTLILADLTSHARNNEFLHGNCVGADAEAAMVAGNMGLSTVSFPSDLSHKQSTFVSKESREPKPALQRNRDIVDEADVLIACPYTFTDVVRSGSWSTIRYAHSQEKHTIIVFPDGTVDERKKWRAA